ncbi:sulfotransferase [Marivirga sp.]|uniref:sulfotransferase n=1 Tax=Marivirga sp. TaxID=2018662 RepID=UPI002D7FC08F|nr:sulfotransferase [Marivirga sp.]HET8860551.1 sulfotransferase [Marivirga sp.]
MKKKISKIYKNVKFRWLNPFLVKKKPKIFCIGLNKSGTTSLRRAFIDLGFIVGDQRIAERLMPQIKNNEFNCLFNYCKSAQVFQDIPFSFFGIYRELHKKFPDAKFILTIRDSPDQWVNSITKFHAKKFSEGKIATANELKNSTYVYKGWIWEAMKFNFNVSEDDPYNKAHLIEKYNSYNTQVMDYFKDSSNFLKINLSDKNSYELFTNFLNIDSPYFDFPWENKTENIKLK